MTPRAPATEEDGATRVPPLRAGRQVDMTDCHANADLIEQSEDPELQCLDMIDALRDCQRILVKPFDARDTKRETECATTKQFVARTWAAYMNKLKLRAHDMRAFFITSGMFAGRDALWITDRSGHTTLSMLRTYERDVRRWRELGESLVDAAVAIPELAAAKVAAERGGKPVDPEDDESVSTRQRDAKAEVAEWQTQRTQNPPSERA
jgi:hypothetical protein